MRDAVPLILPSLLVLALGLASCERVAQELPWEQIDLVKLRPEIEARPEGARGRMIAPLTSYLGSEEVRDLRRVPAWQLARSPRRTSGQVRALQQRAATRVRWTLQPGQEAYLSFVPLGTEALCPCTYVVNVREEGGQAVELHRSPVRPVAVVAPRAVEVDLSRYAGRTIDLFLQVDGPAERLRGQPAPSALWGSPAVYSRKALETRRTERDGSRPNILLVGFDTLRADALGAWGRTPSLTPSLDGLAAESDVWLDAYSAFNVTNPSFVSILTGLYGKNHGVYDLKTPLPPSYTTLAELLSGAGYDTMALLSASHLGNHSSGLGQGFGRVRRSTEHFAAELPVDVAMDWIASQAGNPKPFFLWLHLFDPHTPHTPPAPFALGLRPSAPAGLGPVREWLPFREKGPRTFEEMSLGGHQDLYDGEVAYLDRQVGRLLAFLESRGLLEDTLIAVVADHGENLRDHGILYRHAGLWDTTTHVPLMIRWPGREQEGRRFRGLVQTIDLFPTLVSAAGLEVPPQDGVDLRELTGEGRKGRRVVFAEHADRLGLMARSPDHKYILSQGNNFVPDGAYLYDLKADPREERNLAGQGLPAEKRMEDLLTRWLADRKRRGPDPKSRELTDEEKARLKALGYG